jgi:hypothetical protein
VLIRGFYIVATKYQSVSGSRCRGVNDFLDRDPTFLFNTLPEFHRLINLKKESWVEKLAKYG